MHFLSITTVSCSLLPAASMTEMNPSLSSSVFTSADGQMLGDVEGCAVNHLLAIADELQDLNKNATSVAVAVVFEIYKAPDLLLLKHAKGIEIPFSNMTRKWILEDFRRVLKQAKSSVFVHQDCPRQIILNYPC